MEIGVLGFSGSRNIGDYIQTKAVIDILSKHPDYLAFLPVGTELPNNTQVLLEIN